MREICFKKKCRRQKCVGAAKQDHGESFGAGRTLDTPPPTRKKNSERWLARLLRMVCSKELQESAISGESKGKISCATKQHEPQKEISQSKKKPAAAGRAGFVVSGVCS